MKPAWLARTLVWAGALLWLYWAFQNYDPGVAFATGLMLGAGTFTYPGRPRLVPLVPAIAVLVAAVLLQRGLLEDFYVLLFAYLIGLASPYLAWRLSGSEARP